MTEVEWLACTHPMPMLEHLRGRASDRKLRLFAVACCRSIWHLLSDDRCRESVEMAERSVDHQTAESLLEKALAMANDVLEEALLRTEPFHGYCSACAAASSAALPVVGFDEACRVVADALDAIDDRLAEGRRQAALLRDIFGNPFRLATFDLVWRTATAASLAEAIYTDRAFDRLPILADALEDAGCTDRAVLDHCRQPGEHVRGCWVVDLILSKDR